MMLALQRSVPSDEPQGRAMALFTVEEICEITGARVLSEHAPRRILPVVQRLCTDSRDIRRGDLFVALTGERFDGHEFVGQAVRRGAVGAIVLSPGQSERQRRLVGAVLQAPEFSIRKRAFVLGVADTLRAYQDLATYHRHRFHFPLVAITGSNGKTTTKEMVARMVAQRWQVLKTEGNLNNRIGVPQTLLRLTPRHQAAVVEMGVDQGGQTTRLCEIARPTIGLITNVGPDHLEFFGSLDGSAQAKAELVGMMPASGTLLLNADDEYFEEFAARAACPVISFGLSSRAQVRGLAINADPRRGLTFRLELPGRTRHPWVTLRVHGVHNLYNALAASAVGYVLGLSGTTIADGLARFRPASMRSQVVAADGVRIIDDSYNANPASMKAAIDVLADLGAGTRTIAVLGDMLELGPKAEDMHQEVGSYLANRGITWLVATGMLGRSIAEGARAHGMAHESIQEVVDATGAAAAAKRLVREGDVVLVKGSRGMRMERVIDALREALTGKARGARRRAAS